MNFHYLLIYQFFDYKYFLENHKNYKLNQEIQYFEFLNYNIYILKNI